MQNIQFESLIQDMNSKVNKLKIADENSRSLILNDLIQSIHNLSENSKNHGIPPPRDDISNYSNSFISNIESPTSEDCENIKNLESISQIKSCNAEMKTAVKQTISVFHLASQEFLNGSSYSNHTSILINELDNIKQNIAEILEESRVRSSLSSIFDDKTDNRELQEVYKQISKIQEQISMAGQKLVDSEKEIIKTDRENLELKEQLKMLEKNLNHELITENEEFKQPVCGCLIN